MTKYFEIKILEPRKRERPEKPVKLDGILNHPDRYRYCYATLEREDSCDMGLKICGAEGIFGFVEGYCSNFLGNHEAWIVREVPADEFETKRMDKDRFEPLESRDGCNRPGPSQEARDH